MKPFHNKAWRDNARFQECTGRFDGCTHDPATVVLAHIRRPGTGAATKPSDWQAAFLCSACHRRQEARHVPWEQVFDAVIRTLAIQMETPACRAALFMEWTK